MSQRGYWKALSKSSKKVFVAVADFIRHFRTVIRIVLLVSSLAGFSIIGGLLFQLVEAPPEQHTIDFIAQERKKFLNSMHGLFFTVTAKSEDEEKALYNIRIGFYADDYKAAIRNGTYFVDGKPNPLWTFEGSTYFCVTTFTQLGFGNLAPKSMLGRFVSVLYASFSIPVGSIVFADLGNQLNKLITNFWRIGYASYASLKEQAEEDVDKYEKFDQTIQRSRKQLIEQFKKKEVVNKDKSLWNQFFEQVHDRASTIEKNPPVTVGDGPANPQQATWPDAGGYGYQGDGGPPATDTNINSSASDRNGNAIDDQGVCGCAGPDEPKVSSRKNNNTFIYPNLYCYDATKKRKTLVSDIPIFSKTHKLNEGLRKRRTMHRSTNTPDDGETNYDYCRSNDRKTTQRRTDTDANIERCEEMRDSSRRRDSLPGIRSCKERSDRDTNGNIPGGLDGFFRKLAASPFCPFIVRIAYVNNLVYRRMLQRVFVPTNKVRGRRAQPCRPPLGSDGEVQKRTRIEEEGWEDRDGVIGYRRDFCYNDEECDDNSDDDNDDDNDIDGDDDSEEEEREEEEEGGDDENSLWGDDDNNNARPRAREKLEGRGTDKRPSFEEITGVKDTELDMDKVSVSSAGHGVPEMEPTPVIVMNVILVVMYIIVGTIITMRYENWDYTDGAWFLIMSVLTVGYGDVIPQDTRFFAYFSLYLVLGISIVSNVISMCMRFLTRVNLLVSNIGRDMYNTANARSAFHRIRRKGLRARIRWLILRQHVFNGLPKKLVEDTREHKRFLVQQEKSQARDAYRIYFMLEARNRLEKYKREVAQQQHQQQQAVHHTQMDRELPSARVTGEEVIEVREGALGTLVTDASTMYDKPWSLCKRMRWRTRLRYEAIKNCMAPGVNWRM